MKEEATIFDFARMCNATKYDIQSECRHCPLSGYNNYLGEPCGHFLKDHTDKANEIILKWCEEHPVETRQDRLLKMFPNVLVKYGQVNICPEKFDMDFRESVKCNDYTDCCKCKRDYWLAEVEE